MSDIIDVLKELCREEGISITTFCRDITGSSGNLETWKKGHLRSDSIVKIARYFDISADYILGLSPRRRLTEAENHSREITLTHEEIELIKMYRKIDIRGKTKMLAAAIRESDGET
jgi:plasmid maintenance system antidote protein VapI